MADIVKTIKDRPCKIVNGYTMIVHRDSTNGLRRYWRCSSYHKGCGARGTSAGANGVISMTIQHNHLPDPASPEVSLGLSLCCDILFITRFRSAFVVHKSRRRRLRTVLHRQWHWLPALTRALTSTLFSNCQAIVPCSRWLTALERSRDPRRPTFLATHSSW